MNLQSAAEFVHQTTNVVPTKKLPKLAIFTICSNNYLGMASVLLATAREHHPEAQLFLCLADMPSAGAAYPNDCEVVPADQLDIPDFDCFTFRYDVVELNTALKPYMFQRLLRSGFDRVLYFDPDIQIFQRLNGVLEKLDAGASLVLTPHICAPAEGTHYPDDIGVLLAGTFNLGFLGLALCDEAETVVAWWARRVLHQCISAQSKGLFVDQKFMDLVPSFAEHAVVERDTSLNVAYWNLAQRPLGRSDGQWMIDGRPLTFFHFSGLDINERDHLSRHSQAFRGDAIDGELQALLQQYRALLEASGHRRTPHDSYAFGRLKSGKLISPTIRDIFRSSHLAWYGNPFESYEAYLSGPSRAAWTGRAGGLITNLMDHIHQREPWLRESIRPEQEGASERMVGWFLSEGGKYLGDVRWVEGLAKAVGEQRSGALRKPPPVRIADEAEIDVVGYFRAALGVGEAGRSALRSLNAGGIRARGIDVSGSSWSDLSDDSCQQWLDATGQARHQLFHVNADQLPAIVQGTQDRLRADAYRIVVPFWELESFPDAWLGAFEHVDEVWAPTRFIQTALVKKLRKPVIHMPLALDCELSPVVDQRSARERFELGQDDFLFLFAFDYLSFYQRKNPRAALDAFRIAFARRGTSNVKLVIKTLNSQHASEPGQRLHAELQNDPDVILIDRVLPRSDMWALIGACNAVVSLHRSEGLGLLVAEAHLLCRPVVSTNYSATTDLVNPETGWPVDFRLIPIQAGEYPFHEQQVWAEPDLEHAAWSMQRVVDDDIESRRRAANGRSLVVGSFGTQAVSRRRRARLQQIAQS